MSLLCEEQTGVLRKGFYVVQNEVGLGRQEPGYHNACKLWFTQNGMPVVSKQPHRLLLDGEVAHTLFPDFVAWDAVAIEIKAVSRKLTTSEWVQIRDYMKCRGEALGLLVNFGLDRVHVERVVHTPEPTRLVENWDYWQAAITGHDREVGIAVRDALRSVYAAHTTGYGSEVVLKLLRFALKLRRLSLTINPTARAFFQGVPVDESPLDCLLVENRVILVHTALFDSNQFNISRGLSFLKALGLQWGIAANFGKHEAEFIGLRLKT